MQSKINNIYGLILWNSTEAWNSVIKGKVQYEDKADKYDTIWLM